MPKGATFIGSGLMVFQKIRRSQQHRGAERKGYLERGSKWEQNLLENASTYNFNALAIVLLCT